MRISLKKYPIDIILSITLSTILLLLVFLNIERTIRIMLGLPLILFIPGYILVFILFPTKKTDKGIDIIERIVLSFGLSIALIPLIGLALNYTPWGIKLEYILISIFIFIIGVGSIAIYRWIKTNPNERFIIYLEISLPYPEKKLNKALTILLTLSIIIFVASLVYAIITPKIGEKFTELYILGPEGMADEYPNNLIIGEEVSVILGIVNHEYKTINYTIEVWLINQTTVFNETTQVNETITKHAWYMDKISVMLNHTSIEFEGLWMPQWEYNYNFSIDKEGEHLKLAFLLFINPIKETYSYDIDYKDIIEEKINNAYRETHLFITIM